MGLVSRERRDQRVLEITSTADVSANTFDVTAVKYFRDGIDGDSYDVPFTQTAANPCFVELGEAISGATIIKLAGTIQA